MVKDMCNYIVEVAEEPFLINEGGEMVKDMYNYIVNVYRDDVKKEGGEMVKDCVII